MSRNTRVRLIIQFVEYMIGGGVYFWSGLGVFAIGYSVFHWNWLWSKMLADLIGWTLGYIVQRYWTFRNPELVKNPIKVGLRYVAITALNFLIDYTLIGSLKHIGIKPYGGLFISSGFFTIWNYLWYKFWVFRVKSSPKETV